jgi:hypothetical protein
MERVMGIEPTPSAWKAEVLPLNYTRLALIRRRLADLETVVSTPRLDLAPLSDRTW